MTEEGGSDDQQRGIRGDDGVSKQVYQNSQG